MATDMSDSTHSTHSLLKEARHLTSHYAPGQQRRSVFVAYTISDFLPLGYLVAEQQT